VFESSKFENLKKMNTGPTPLSERDPYPFPQPQGDLQFRGKDDSKNYKDPHKIISRKEDQWHRLFNKKTLASSRREIFHHDKCAPNDYLDFELKSVYDHHNQFMRGNNEVMYQNETFGNPDMRQLKNRAQKSNIVDPRESSDGLENTTLKVIEARHREDSNNHDGAIPSHHNAATNRGYSRKYSSVVLS
jgi:hypothetical protein